MSDDKCNVDSELFLYNQTSGEVLLNF